MKLYLSILALTTGLLFFACSKPKHGPLPPYIPPPIDTTLVPPNTLPSRDPIDFDVDNTWEVEVEGVLHKGTIDTSFMQIVQTSTSDTTVTWIGTSYEKDFNIRLNLRFDRTTMSNPGSNITVYGTLEFDSCSKNLFFASEYASSYRNVKWTVDSCNGKKIKGTFQAIGASTDSHDIGLRFINGKFSCEFNRPLPVKNAYSYINQGLQKQGYFNVAQMESDALVLMGSDYSSKIVDKRIYLAIRTGGAVRPGIYRSLEGNVVFSEVDNFSQNIPYMADSAWDFTVKINSIDGNYVTGEFYGTNVYLSSMDAKLGTFRCLIKNYRPQSDQDTKWSFNAHYFRNYIEPSIHMFGGNLNTAKVTFENNRYKIRLTGASDNGASPFSMVIGSKTPFIDYVAGVTKFEVDSLLYTSPRKLWNGNFERLEVYPPDSYTFKPMFCILETFNESQVSGRLEGFIRSINTEGSSFGSEVSFSKFNARF